MEIEATLFQRVVKGSLSKLGYIFIALGMFIAEQTLMLVIMSPEIFNLKYTTSLTVINSSLVILFCLLTLWLAKKMNLTDFKLKMNIPKFIGIISLATVCQFVTSIIGGIILANSGEVTTANQQNIENLSEIVPLLPYVLTLVFLAAIVEELIFRGLVIGKLSPKYRWIGFLLSVILFALIHNPTNLGSWITYGGMGAILAFTYYKTNSLGTSMAIHFVNNAIATLFMMLPLLLQK
ncbi:type II CAAX endopeptidase family protein [Pseudolactococcus yaeyamensis]